MYKIQLDMLDASRVYIYEDTEYRLELRLTVHNNIDLAYKLIDYLNNESEKCLSQA